MKLLGQGNAYEVRSSCMRFSKGDVLYSRMRPYLNKVWVADFDGICSAEFLVFSALGGLNKRFLALRLNAEDFVAFANRQVSGERPRISFEKLSHFSVDLPPGEEQRRIVEKLDDVLSRLSRAQVATQRASDRLHRYRAATIEAGLSGELTRTWREKRIEELLSQRDKLALSDILGRRRIVWETKELERSRSTGRKLKDSWRSRYPEPESPSKADLPTLPSTWLWLGWDQVGFSQNGRAVSSQLYSKTGIKLLRPGNLYADGTVQWNSKNTRYVPTRLEREHAEHVVRGDELVINLTAQSLKDDFLGRVCLTSTDEHCFLNQRIARLTPVLGTPKFFLYVLKSSRFRQFVAHLNSGSLIQHMFTSQLATFSLPFPPTEEQVEIVNEVERRLSSADRLDAALQQQSERSGNARQTILREAFLGKLVPQDPQDESATILFARIQAAREAPVEKATGERMPKNISGKRPEARRSLLTVLRENGRPMTPEELFQAAGYIQETVDDFFAELRELTASPVQVLEERRQGKILLRIAS